MRHLFWGALLLMTFTGCKNEIKETNNLPAQDHLKEEWPKAQDAVENVFTYYDAYLENSLEYSEGKVGAKKNGKWGVVDEENRLYFDFEYDTIIGNASSVAVKKDGTFYIYDDHRQEISSVRADNLSPLMSSFYSAHKGDKKAIINPNGLMILDFRFDGITGPRDESYFLGQQDGKWQAFDLAGNLIDKGKGARAADWLNEFTVGLKSYGPLKIGMTKEELETSVGWPLKKLYEEEQCEMYSLGDDFLDLNLMINKEVGNSSTLERISIFQEGILTKSGIGIGSSEKEVKSTYGSKIVSEANKYNEQATDLLYVPQDRRDRNYRLNFLSNKDKVEQYSIGRLPSIFFVEGCL